MVDGASLWLQQLLTPITYDPLRDFAPLMIAVRAPNVVIVNPSIPVASVKELIAFGVETVASSPEEFAALIRRDIERWGKVIKEAGIRVQ